MDHRKDTTLSLQFRNLSPARAAHLHDVAALLGAFDPEPAGPLDALIELAEELERNRTRSRRSPPRCRRSSAHRNNMETSA